MEFMKQIDEEHIQTNGTRKAAKDSQLEFVHAYIPDPSSIKRKAEEKVTHIHDLIEEKYQIGEKVKEWKEEGAIAWLEKKSKLKQQLKESNLISEVADEDELLKEVLDGAAPDSARYINQIL